MVRHIADRVSVVHLGRTVETGTAEEVFERPRHPYTQALLSAVPLPDPERERRRTRILPAGDPPSPTRRYEGCRFRSRCPVYAEPGEEDRERCERDVPAGEATGHSAACHFPGRTPAVSGTSPTTAVRSHPGSPGRSRRA
ncbi:oligopeptide/dipeptide ABC transporter ATP-binding protein [Streptomyces sp. NPDC058545]|uniref:oligopeptide/dipeptide ABC transporter ATP-binding protein n=1 Tax=Streptomyces sp. NPDC058545 TaxID=3346544 RepID=UPI0036507301